MSENLNNRLASRINAYWRSRGRQSDARAEFCAFTISAKGQTLVCYEWTIRSSIGLYLPPSIEGTP